MTGPASAWAHVSTSVRQDQTLISLTTPKDQDPTVYYYSSDHSCGTYPSQVFLA